MAEISRSQALAQLPEAEKDPLRSTEPSLDLLQSLDALLERYLYLLHRHQTLHAELGKQLSSGFFSLAQANYSCPPGRRYGQDYYDERMKATRRISLQPSSVSTDRDGKTSLENEGNEDDRRCDYSHTFKIDSTLIDYPAEEEKPKSETTEPAKGSMEGSEFSSSDSDGDQTTAGETEVSSTPQEAREIESSRSSGYKSPKRGLPSPDPIKWYGVLVPLSLRSAQKSFVAATKMSLPELATVMAEMRDVERRVAELRNELALV